METDDTTVYVYEVTVHNGLRKLRFYIQAATTADLLRKFTSALMMPTEFARVEITIQALGELL